MPKDPYLIEFGANLRRYRLEKGYSQEQLSLKAGLGRNFVGECERGQRNATVISSVRLSKVLGINPGQLMPVLFK